MAQLRPKQPTTPPPLYLSTIDATVPNYNNNNNNDTNNNPPTTPPSITAKNKATHNADTNDDEIQQPPTDEGHKPNKTNISPDSPWGNQRTPLTDDNNSTLRIHSQNLNCIFDLDGSGLDEAFHAVRTIGSTIFTFQETHGDKLNLKSNGLMHKSARKVWRDQHCFCSIATASTSSHVDTFSKAGGVMAGVTGDLHGRIRSKIEDVFGR